MTGGAQGKGEVDAICEAMSGCVASSAAVAGDAARRRALPVSALGGYQGGGCSPSSGLSFSYALSY